MGNLIPDTPRLPRTGRIAFVGALALLMMALAIFAALFELQHDRDVQHQNEDALALSQLAFDAESLASRMRALQEMSAQPGARAPMVGNELHEVLRADGAEPVGFVAPADVEGWISAIGKALAAKPAPQLLASFARAIARKYSRQRMMESYLSLFEAHRELEQETAGLQTAAERARP